MNLIVIPVLVNQAMTERCIRTLVAQDIEGGVQVLAIDNGSTDGTGAWLRTLRDPIITQRYSRTRSLHVVWNEALRWAFEKMRLPHVLVVNNDVELTPETYRLLVADEGPFVTGVGVDRRGQHGTGKQRRPHPDFSCFLIRRECWERVGPFDEEFWAFYGDNSYHLRMERAGVQAVSLDVPFYHVASGTLKSVDFELREHICALAAQDKQKFIAKYGFTPTDPEYAAQFKR